MRLATSVRVISPVTQLGRVRGNVAAGGSAHKTPTSSRAATCVEGGPCPARYYTTTGFCAILERKPNIYQDRLGTSMGKPQKKTRFVSQPVPDVWTYNTNAKNILGAGGFNTGTMGRGKNTPVLRCHFSIKTITLPRQAGDKHRETNKSGVSLGWLMDDRPPVAIDAVFDAGEEEPSRLCACPYIEITGRQSFLQAPT